MLKLIDSHPEFLPLYQDISEFRKKPKEVIGMFSEALRIMDRNTTKYMIDELKQRAETAEEKLELSQKKLIGKVCRKLQKGMDVETIADQLDEEPDEIRRITEAAEKMSPEYDIEKLYSELCQPNCSS